jgi:cell division transport system permease protein
VRYTLTELAQGLRRNISMHLAVVLTLFVSLTLVGLGVLVNQQTQKATDYWEGELQITFWLCKERDSNPACVGEVTQAQKDAIVKVVEDNPEVASYRFESKEEAYDKLKEIFDPDEIEGSDSGVPVITAADMPESLWVELKDPERFEGIVSAVTGLDGVSGHRDARATLKAIYSTMNALQWGALGTALFLVLAALLLVANTIRLAAFARRREIGIMRLVGASTLYIALPFLLEAVVTAVLGVALAAGALVAFEKFAILDRVKGDLSFIPWVDWSEVQYAVAAIAILGPLLTLLPTLVLTRKYLKV